eukprot:TRINITY_DN3233_c3_g7_i1.p1 TRINITY_DN3233_c3_g7~~TRINITY_DN3233_c3_g7_i1.p1  ORF type:complete len:1110 (+),score=367.33 TRINITY_DN3233_c3_g7_i1:83-3412(+)
MSLIHSKDLIEKNIKTGSVIRVNGNQYSVENEIGSGAFGTVFQVCDLVTNKGYALKRIVAMNIHTQTQTEIEINIFQSLQHCEYIPKIKEFEKINVNSDRIIYLIVMDFCNDSLVHQLKKRKTKNRRNHFSEAELIELGLDIAKAIKEIHDIGYIHRDVKIENVLRANGKWLLCDFGSATDEEFVAKDRSSVLKIENELFKFTTPIYRPPELWDLWRKQPIGKPMDIFAFGMMLYYAAYFTYPYNELDCKLGIVSGKLNFPETPRYPQIERIIKECFTNDSTLRPNIHSIIDFLKGNFPNVNTTLPKVMYADDVQQSFFFDFDDNTETQRTNSSPPQKEENFDEIFFTENTKKEQSVENWFMDAETSNEHNKVLTKPRLAKQDYVTPLNQSNGFSESTSQEFFDSFETNQSNTSNNSNFEDEFFEINPKRSSVESIQSDFSFGSVSSHNSHQRTANIHTQSKASLVSPDMNSFQQSFENWDDHNPQPSDDDGQPLFFDEQNMINSGISKASNETSFFAEEEEDRNQNFADHQNAQETFFSDDFSENEVKAIEIKASNNNDFQNAKKKESASLFNHFASNKTNELRKASGFDDIGDKKTLGFEIEDRINKNDINISNKRILSHETSKAIEHWTDRISAFSGGITEHVVKATSRKNDPPRHKHTRFIICWVEEHNTEMDEFMSALLRRPLNDPIVAAKSLMVLCRILQQASFFFIRHISSSLRKNNQPNLFTIVNKCSFSAGLKPLIKDAIEYLENRIALHNKVHQLEGNFSLDSIIWFNVSNHLRETDPNFHLTNKSFEMNEQLEILHDVFAKGTWRDNLLDMGIKMFENTITYLKRYKNIIAREEEDSVMIDSLFIVVLDDAIMFWKSLYWCLGASVILRLRNIVVETILEKFEKATEIFMDLIKFFDNQTDISTRVNIPPELLIGLSHDLFVFSSLEILNIWPNVSLDWNVRRKLSDKFSLFTKNHARFVESSSSPIEEKDTKIQREDDNENLNVEKEKEIEVNQIKYDDNNEVNKVLSDDDFFQVVNTSSDVEQFFNIETQNSEIYDGPAPLENVQEVAETKNFEEFFDTIETHQSSQNQNIVTQKDGKINCWDTSIRNDLDDIFDF